MAARLLKLHRWIAIAFALPLVFVLATGLILSFEPWLVHRAIEPGRVTAERIATLLAKHDAKGEARAIVHRGYDRTLTIGGGRGGGGIVVDVVSGEARPGISAMANLPPSAPPLTGPPVAQQQPAKPMPLLDAVRIVGKSHDLSGLVWIRTQGGNLMARVVEGGEYRTFRVTREGYGGDAAQLAAAVARGHFCGRLVGVAQRDHVVRADRIARDRAHHVGANDAAAKAPVGRARAGSGLMEAGVT